MLLFETAAFLREVPITEFLFGTVWTPLFSDKHFGVLPLVSGTLLTSAIAMVVALPAGLLAAIYLSEYALGRRAPLVRPVLEVLAGVPTVVYGYFALLFVTPLLQGIVPGLAGFNALGPGIVMGIMILPLVSSLSEDALHSVPNGLREGAYALGATRMQASLRVVVPAAFSGISAAVDPRGVARDRRNDDRRDRRRPAAAAHARSARAGRNDDRLHRAGQPRRHAGRHARVPDDLRGRHAAVPEHVHAEPRSRTGCASGSARSTHDAPRRRPADVVRPPSALGDRLLASFGLLVDAARRWSRSARCSTTSSPTAPAAVVGVHHQLPVAARRAMPASMPALVGSSTSSPSPRPSPSRSGSARRFTSRSTADAADCRG